MSQSHQLQLAFSSFVTKRIRSEVDARPTTVTYDVFSRWDVTSDNGLVIGSTQPVDASSCQTGTDIDFVAPS
ncbi:MULTISPECIES: hypothetical protein [Rhizobium]|uniref:hypothetical protein n=1 Tax=Rhizobium TaxID=379 RepID=UPI000409B68F|nr:MULTISPECIES: hypothetical protein [Rhizobium]UFS81567.1 hypothetical protein LPB79_25175 [Rhizobium sp. T136]